MRIFAVIFSYNRRVMLTQLLDEVEAQPDLEFVILDDGSDFVLDHPKFVQYEHGGKENFWSMWHQALQHVKTVDADCYLFLQDDIKDIDFNEIRRRHVYHAHLPYAYNIIFDGRLNCWNVKKPIDIDRDTWQVGFTDCMFFCNKSALARLGYFVHKINPMRFVHNPGISSGVGQQLTQRFNQQGVKLYLPKKSLAYHGDHPSVMHYEVRKKNPLISR